MQIFIDGDACPVKEIIYEEALKRGMLVTLVTSISHHSNKELPKNVTVVYVDEGSDSVDFKLVSLVKRGDLLITQDYGLASLVLSKGVRILHHLGYEYTQNNIGQMLESRYHGAQMRKSGQRTKGPKKFKQADRDNFTQALIELLEES